MQRLIAAVVAIFSAAASLAAPANVCTDPYWKNTLRCTFSPNTPPQPNIGELPDLPANQPVPAFTRVFLPDPNIRCTDGTAPLIYIDKAVCTNPNGCGAGIERGDPVESNRWIFSVSGGTACAKEQCAALYAEPDERGSMGSSTKPLFKEMNGIHDPDPVANPMFAGYNRVRIEKCTFDRYMGRSADEAPGGAYTGTGPGGQEVGFNLYYHGFFIIEEALHELQNGLRYTAWTRTPAPGSRRRACCGPSGGPQVTPFTETLPPLADAEVVLFIGHSNASHGLYHNIDHIVALLQAMPGFDGDVRAMFDANFLPSIENEASFATSAPAGKDAYDGIWSGPTSVRGESFTYDGEEFYETANTAQQYQQYKAVLDASCMDAHTSNNTTWMCKDRQHVLFNHIATPFFAREDFLDPNLEHLDAPLGHLLYWGEPKHYAYCPDSNPCNPRMNAAEYRARIAKQMQTLLNGIYTRSELARGVDKSTLRNPTVFAWMPQCSQHEGSFDDDSFQGATIATEGSASFSMREWTEEFMNAPRSGVRRYKIDGVNDLSGAAMRTTRCE
ncbi:MAG TPA: pectin acetylesterase-family hydrolase [Thermoanaerobaculia bacterium]